MWSVPSRESWAPGSARAGNARGGAGEKAGRGWESVGVFHSYSAVQGRPPQVAQQQNERIPSPLPFPDQVSPAARMAPSVAVVGDTSVRSKSVPSRPLQAPTQGPSSSRASDLEFFRLSTPTIPLQEQAHLVVPQRPSPWQGRSAWSPLVVTAPAAFAGNCSDLDQRGRSATVPNVRSIYPEGPHAFYRAPLIPTPVAQAPRLQHGSQIPQQRVIPQDSPHLVQPQPPSQPEFPSRTSSSSSAAKGRSAGDTPAGFSTAFCRPPPLSAMESDSGDPRVVFPDAITLDPTTQAESSSSRVAAVSHAGQTAEKTGHDFIDARKEANANTPLNLETLSAIRSAGDVNPRDRGKQDTSEVTRKDTPPASKSAQTPESMENTYSSQGGAPLAAALQPPAWHSPAAEESLGGNTSGIIRQRYKQARQQQPVIHPPVESVPPAPRPTRPTDLQKRRMSLWARGAQHYRDALWVLQLDASDVVPEVNLPYLGPYDLTHSVLPEKVDTLGRQEVNEAGSSTYSGTDGVDNVGRSPLASAEDGKCSHGYGGVDARGSQWILRRLYAQAESHVELQRFRSLYSPTLAGMTAIYCLTSLLFFFCGVTPNFFRYARLSWASTPSFPSESRSLLAPHAFAVGVLSLAASVCIFLVAVLSFFCFRRHLRASLLRREAGSSKWNMSTPGSASTQKASCSYGGYLCSSITQDNACTEKQCVQDLLAAEYRGLYTRCARGDIVAGHTHALETADTILKLYLDRLKEDISDSQLGRPSDGDEEDRSKAEELKLAGSDRCNVATADAEDKRGRSAASSLTKREGHLHVSGPSATGSLLQNSKAYAAFIQDATDKNLRAHASLFKDSRVSTGVDKDALLTPIETDIRIHSLRTMWLILGCAITGAVARMQLSLLLSETVTVSGLADGMQQQRGFGAKPSTWNTPPSAADDVFFPAYTPSSPASWWERLRMEWQDRGQAVCFTPRIHPSNAGLSRPHELAGAALPSPATMVMTALWTSLNRLATFQMHAAGFLLLAQFIAVALMLQPRLELRLIPPMAKLTAWLQLGMGVVELLCGGFNALTLILGEVVIKELLLMVVYLAAQRVVQLSRERFAEQISCRSRLPATFSTAAAAGALLASACSACGAAAAAEVLLRERRKKLRWGRTSILRQPSTVAQESISPT